MATCRDLADRNSRGSLRRGHGALRRDAVRMVLRSPRGEQRVSSRKTRPDIGFVRDAFSRVALAAWVCMVASGACWFVLVAMQMSGRPLEALDWATITTVLGSTIFGRPGGSCLDGLGTGLHLADPARQSAASARGVRLVCRHRGRTPGRPRLGGHANAEVGADGVIHHASDSMHLLAAGHGLAVWLRSRRFSGHSAARLRAATSTVAPRPWRASATGRRSAWQFLS